MIILPRHEEINAIAVREALALLITVFLLTPGVAPLPFMTT